MIRKFMLDCDCGCGCGSDNESDKDHDHDDCGCGGCGQGQDMIRLSLDDDTELDCVVLSIFPAGDKEYIALLPTEGEEAEEGEVYLYRYSESEDGQPLLDNIEDDDEYDLVADAFDHMLDDMEYDEIIDEEELEEDEE